MERLARDAGVDAVPSRKAPRRRGPAGGRRPHPERRAGPGEPGPPPARGRAAWPPSAAAGAWWPWRPRRLRQPRPAQLPRPPLLTGRGDLAPDLGAQAPRAGRQGRMRRCGQSYLDRAAARRDPADRAVTSSGAVSCCCCTTTTTAPRGWCSTSRWRPRSTRCCPPWQKYVTPPALLFQGGPVALDSALGLVTVPGDAPSRSGCAGSSAAVGLVDLDMPPPVVAAEVAGLRIFAGLRRVVRRPARGRDRGRAPGTSSTPRPATPSPPSPTVCGAACCAASAATSRSWRPSPRTPR